MPPSTLFTQTSSKQHHSNESWTKIPVTASSTYTPSSNHHSYKPLKNTPVTTSSTYTLSKQHHLYKPLTKTPVPTSYTPSKCYTQPSNTSTTGTRIPSNAITTAYTTSRPSSTQPASVTRTLSQPIQTTAFSQPPSTSRVWTPSQSSFIHHTINQLGQPQPNDELKKMLE